MAQIETKTTPLALSDPALDPDQVRANLIMIMESMGFIPNWDNFTALANQLSMLANRLGTNGTPDPWTPKYVYGVYKGYKTCKASPAFGRAIMALGEVVDSTPVGVAGAQYIRVLVYPGQVPEGALIPRSAKVARCERPGCPVVFVKASPGQRFHDPECQKLWAKEKRKMREVSHG